MVRFHENQILNRSQSVSTKSLISKGEAWMFGFEIDALGIAIGIALMVVLEATFFWTIFSD